MSRGVRIVLAVLGLLVLIVLVSNDREAPTDAVSEETVLSKTERRNAMLSVFFHGYPERYGQDSIPDPYTPMPITAAAKLLSDDEGAAAENRQRQAIVVLSVGHFEQGAIDEPDIRVALESLGAPIEAIETGLSDGDYSDRNEEESAVYRILEVEGLGANCADSTTDVGYDLVTQGTLAALTVTGLQRDFDELAVIFDPQNWSHCSDFFEDSFVAKEVAGSYPRDGNGNAEPDPSPPTAGTTWRKVLFEYYDTSQPGFDSWFKNLLQIDAHRTGDMFYFEYDLHESIKTKIGPFTYNKGLARDQGYASVRQLPDSTVKITGLKVMQYDAQLAYLNPYVSLYLHTMGAESARIACTCPVPEDSVSAGFWQSLFEWLFGSWL